MNTASTHKLALFSTESEAIDFCVSNFYELAARAIQQRGVFTVALSGGSTPKNLYRALLNSTQITSIDWKKVLVFWSDERAVPPNDPDSNWKMAIEFFDKPPLSFAQKFRMEAESTDLEASATRYEELLISLCPEKRLDLIYLGMGDDGHTASLFPGTEALNEKRRLIAANFIPEKKAWRMTFTLPCINSARNIVVLVFGEKKATVLQKALEKSSEKMYPISQIGTAGVPALFVCDLAASKLLK